MAKPSPRKNKQRSTFRLELPAEETHWQCQSRDQGVILLAEDGEEEVMLLRRAFAKANLLNPLQVVSTGEEAIAYLQGEGKFADRNQYPLPTLFLLDLKMPRKSGFEVLEWIRKQPGLAALRTVVLTSSDDVWDLRRAYQLGAASFLVKPVDFHHFVEITLSLKGYWLWLTRDPRTAQPARATGTP